MHATLIGFAWDRLEPRGDAWTSRLECCPGLGRFREVGYTLDYLNSDANIEPFRREHLDRFIALVADEGWDEYSGEPEKTFRALTAPGSTTLVALDGERVAGGIQVQSDGLLQAHVSLLLIAPQARGRGLGAALLREGLARAGGDRLDIRTRTEGFYERLGATRSLGFRLTRADLGLDSESVD